MVFGFEIFEVFHKVLGKLFQLNSLIHEFTSTSDAPWENGPFLLLQQDNLAAQNEDNIKRLAFVNDASVSFARKSPPLKTPLLKSKKSWKGGLSGEWDCFIYNTSPNCTDAEALVDHTLGRELKNGVRDYFWSDFESSFERTK